MSERTPLRPRKIEHPFGSEIPRHWLGGNVFGTAVANALNLVFPKGERFFVRSVRHYMDRITDEAQLRDVRGFIGQEVRHGIEHERFFDVLRAQGLKIDGFLALYDFVCYRVLEGITPPALHLAATAAAEHFTASFSYSALTQDHLDELAHPTMRDLLKWHAAEEIEHKAIAFDLLKQVDDRYRLRMAGLVLAAVPLVGFWVLGTLWLLSQEKDLSLQKILSDRRTMRSRGDLAGEDVMRAILEYVRRDFHPNQRDDYGLAREELAYVERKIAEAGRAA